MARRLLVKVEGEVPDCTREYGVGPNTPQQTCGGEGSAAGRTSVKWHSGEHKLKGERKSNNFQRWKLQVVTVKSDESR